MSAMHKMHPAQRNIFQIYIFPKIGATQVET